jgi:acetylornithine deacetylase/succinyl-diaminopimelate desuccinylase-like protein
VRVLNEKDYRLFERLVSLSEKEMLQAMAQYLKARYSNNVIITKDYIVAIGDIPVALVAHMDTVFKTPVSNLYYDQRKGVLWSPEGLGADDRAGIFAIIKIIQEGLRPSIILTTGEEQGGVGACALVEAHSKCPIPNLKYMIQLEKLMTSILYV